MKSVLRWTGIVLPLALLAAASIVAARGGGAPTDIVFAALAAAVLGLLLTLLLRSAAVITGHISDIPPPSNERLKQLELDKRLVLRSLKDLDLDLQLGRIDEALAAELSAPLRERAMGLLRQIDEARVGSTSTTVDDEIEREIRLRLEDTTATAASTGQTSRPGDTAPPSEANIEQTPAAPETAMS